MSNRIKPLLTDFELLFLQELEPSASRWGVEVLIKPRIADTLIIWGSGISSEEYRFALSSHFDFALTQGDKHRTPAFAVEVDDLLHDTDPEVMRRDKLKNSICHQLGMPIIRVDGGHLRKVENRSLLCLLVDWWFLTVRVQKSGYFNGLRIPATIWEQQLYYLDVSQSA